MSGRAIKDEYRTKDDTESYFFEFQELPDRNWRVYILKQPSYGSRSTDGHSTHRYFSAATGRTWICWSVPIRSLAEARSVAGQWAEKTQRYIRTGQGF